MSIPSQITNHTDLAYNTLLYQFQDKPIIQALLKTWTDKFQEVENDLYDLMTKTLFLNAEGTNLERYGQLFGIKFPEGLDDKEYREILISEIMRRSSDGTPDRIRQILESTTGITDTRVFEHFNGKQDPWVMGCLNIYGYADDTVTFDLSQETKEARYLKWASPVTTGSCVLGLHRDEPSSLFIPSEIVQAPLEKLGLTSNKTLNPSIDEDLSEWSNNSVGSITYERTFTDPVASPAPQHNDGAIRITAGSSEIPLVYQQITGLTAGREYTASATIRDCATTSGAKLLIGTTQGADDLASSETLVSNGSMHVNFIAPPSGIIWFTAQSNVNATADWSALLDLLEIYDSEVGYDQDELVDQTDDWIGIKPTASGSVSENSENAILAEFENQIHRFQVDTTSNSSNLDIEDFDVDTSLGIEDFNVEFRDDIRPSNDKGICLEISQILLTEEYNEQF